LTLDGAGGNNTLAGPNQNDVWNITGANQGNIAGVVPTFTNFQNLVGGTGADDFVLSPSAKITSIDGGAGLDTLDYHLNTTQVAVALTVPGSTDGFNGYSSPGTGITNNNSFSNIDVVVGGTANNDYLAGTNAGGAFTITTTNSFYVSQSHGLTFSNFESVA